MKRGIVVILLAAACGQETAEKPQLQQPERPGTEVVARAFLQAYRAKDVAKMRELSVAANRTVYDDLIREGEANPRYRSIFEGWRWQAVEAWEGELHGVRYARDRAYARFGRIEKALALVKLRREEGGWRVEDVAKVSEEHFSSMSEEEPKDDVR